MAADPSSAPPTNRNPADRRRVKTGIVLLNLGGPPTLDAVEPFLLELFADREIIHLPFQQWLGPFIARRRAPAVRALYASIGGGSPILRYTEAQGRGLVERLDRLSPDTAPHGFYVAFRYVRPKSEDALQAMRADGVERAVAFTQYPQFSCATTGSSLNDLWRTVDRLGLKEAFQWSILDRWPIHDGFIEAVAETVREGLQGFSPGDRGKVVLLFSAHSLPMRFVNRGDPYPAEIGATMEQVMRRLRYSHPHLLAYQSKVGPVKWLEPSTEWVIRQLAARGDKHVLVIPIAFTSDHIETLSELDREYGHLAESLGITHFRRVPALNDRPAFLDAIADLVREHLSSGQVYSTKYPLRCPGCVNPACRGIANPIPARSVLSERGA
jgi:protoporphyrin/coproporphyrin ferrochelatase